MQRWKDYKFEASLEKVRVRSYVKKNYQQNDWKCGSSGRVLACQMKGTKFNLRIKKKKKKRAKTNKQVKKKREKNIMTGTRKSKTQ
jgi:hypothetical protein